MPTNKTSPQKPAPASKAKTAAALCVPVVKLEAETPADSRDDPKALLEALQVYFDVRDGSYLTQLNGRFVGMKKNDLTMRFRALGLRDDLYVKTKDRGSLREIDYPFYVAQNERMIDFAGAIAGRRVGVFNDSLGKKYLVTDEATGVWNVLIKKPAPKLFPAFMDELFAGEQADIIGFWLSLSLRAMRAVDFSPAQANFFAGGPGCGKSLFQYMLTELFGGRAANPFKYLMGENFNKDLCVAEHWMVEDPGTSTDIRTRRLFGEMIKEATVNRDIRINGKGKDAGLVQIFRRVTISINKEKESLAVAPPMVEGVKDKINLFMCEHAEKSLHPFRDKSGKVDRARLWGAFMAEVHAVRSWLLEKYKTVPKAWADDRMGIRAFHHPEILSELSSMTYESRFLELVDEKFFSDADDGSPELPIEKKAADFQKVLLDHNRFEAEKVLRYPGQCGSHLSKLAASNPERVAKRVLHGHTLWTIKPPSKIEKTKEI